MVEHAKRPPARHPRNAPGPFYVARGSCGGCTAGRDEAGALVSFDADGCYFARQPASDVEVDDAIRALLHACTSAYRYGGSDPTIRRRLAELGESAACDVPLPGHGLVVRNIVRFALPLNAAATTGSATDHAREVATVLLHWFRATWPHGRCTVPATGDAHRAYFAYDVGTPRSVPTDYVLERLHDRAIDPARSPYRDALPIQSWRLVTERARFPPVWLHKTLVEGGASPIAWFSRAEWAEGLPGRLLPY